MTTVDVLFASSLRARVVRFAGFTKILAEETLLAVSKWRMEARQLYTLAHLNDHLLEDIGVQPANARNPHLQAPRNGFSRHMTQAWRNAKTRAVQAPNTFTLVQTEAANDSNANLDLPHAA